MEDTTGLKKTALYDRHVALGATMAPFAGFYMPIQYEGILREHEAARQAAVVFDTGHMGEIRVQGGSALADLERLVTCRVSSLEPGQCRYGFLCNEQGGVVDDLLVYRLGSDEFMLVVNASNRARDVEWVTARRSAGTGVKDLSDATAKLDIQGPDSPRIVQSLISDSLRGLRYYRFLHTTYRGRKMLISRTGYTGEIGFEFYGDKEIGPLFWDDCLRRGAAPAGLGARDTLRLEMGMPLYGHELSETRNAAEAGFTKAIAADKEFVGSSVVLAEERRTEALIGVAMESRRAARQGDAVLDPASGRRIGVVTSGSFSPSLKAAVAMAYVERSFRAPGVKVLVEAARQRLAGAVSELPFYTRGTARKPMGEFLEE